MSAVISDIAQLLRSSLNLMNIRKRWPGKVRPSGHDMQAIVLEERLEVFLELSDSRSGAALDRQGAVGQRCSWSRLALSPAPIFSEFGCMLLEEFVYSRNTFRSSRAVSRPAQCLIELGEVIPPGSQSSICGQGCLCSFQISLAGVCHETHDCFCLYRLKET